MAHIKNKNFARTQPVFNAGDIIEGCNISQEEPGTEICNGVTGLVFTPPCNLHNCILPDDAVILPGCFVYQGSIENEEEENNQLAAIVEEYGKDNLLKEIGNVYINNYLGKDKVSL